jgi:hypothetical protein
VADEYNDDDTELPEPDEPYGGDLYSGLTDDNSENTER